jgi:hypothetical protein
MCRHDGCGAIGRAVVQHQDLELDPLARERGAERGTDVGLFVARRDQQ